MALLDEGEVKLFGKYWGDNDLAHNDDFWADVYEHYSKEPRDAPLPVQYNPLTVRRVLGMLNCPPGECGKCCFYKTIKVNAYDIQRIIDSTSYSSEEVKGFVNTEDDKMYLNGHPDGCPFLKENSCTVYEARPDACYLFPIGSKDAELGGKAVQQMQMRIRCPQALDVARKLITQALSKGDKLLLPDLTIIQKVF